MTNNSISSAIFKKSKPTFRATGKFYRESVSNHVLRSNLQLCFRFYHCLSFLYVHCIHLELTNFQADRERVEKGAMVVSALPPPPPPPPPEPVKSGLVSVFFLSSTRQEEKRVLFSSSFAAFVLCLIGFDLDSHPSSGRSWLGVLQGILSNCARWPGRCRKEVRFLRDFLLPYYSSSQSEQHTAVPPQFTSSRTSQSVRGLSC
jgi:hypothetical protein